MTKQEREHFAKLAEHYNRKDAIQILENMKKGIYLWNNDEVLDMAIEALKQEPCEDAISRQAVLEGLAYIAKAKAKSDAQKSMMGRTMFFVEQLPSVSTEKTGHWIMHEKHRECSECTVWLPKDMPRNSFYPNC